MLSRPQEIRIDEIIIGERFRKDMGDVDALAESIKELGLLQPIVVTTSYQLVAGQRRIAAFKQLGKTQIAAHVAQDLDDTLRLVQAERDENTCRKPLAISETLAVGDAIEALEKEAAKDRQRQGGRPSKNGKRGGKFPHHSKGKARDKVGKSLGMSGKTYDKAKQVRDAAKEDPENFGDLMEEMDTTGRVDKPFRKLKDRKRDAKAKSVRDGMVKSGSTLRDTYVKTGDFRELLSGYPDNSVDLIFTDPPYHQKYVSLYGELAKHAARILKPGGSLITYAGQYSLPQILASMCEHVRFWWLFALKFNGSAIPQHGKKVLAGWKPLLWFVKGSYRGSRLIPDPIPGTLPDNTNHERNWAQSIKEAEYLIDYLTHPGALVLDPMCGGGTTVIAALSLGRKAVGIEIDQRQAAIARKAVHDYLIREQQRTLWLEICAMLPPGLWEEVKKQKTWYSDPAQ